MPGPLATSLGAAELAALARALVPPAVEWLADALEGALADVWRDPTPAAARAYLRALVPAVEHERANRHYEAEGYHGEVPFPRVGPWACTASLGLGGNGQALAARHVVTGQPATVKLRSGQEGSVHQWCGGELPPPWLRVYDEGLLEVPGLDEPWLWVAREPALETWADYAGRHGGRVPDVGEALGVFALACEGVAALHARRVFRWSAHQRNVFRTGRGWRLGDLGRCVMAAGPDDPGLGAIFGQGHRPPAERSAFLGLLDAGPWRSSMSAGVFARDPVREHRLRLDDGAMLAGLLLDLLGVNRWEAFLRAIRGAEVCSGRYVLTGSGRVDRRLSRVLNRAWLGDAGGALALARGEGWEAGYADPLALLADVLRV